MQFVEQIRKEMFPVKQISELFIEIENVDGTRPTTYANPITDPDMFEQFINREESFIN